MTDLYSSGMTRIGDAQSLTTAATITGSFIASDTNMLVRLGSSKPKSARQRALTLMFSSNADNNTGSFALWGRQVFVANGSETVSAIISLGTGTFTSGSISCTGAPFIGTEFLADTITFTPSAFLSTLLTTMTAPAPMVWSPADNTPAVLRIEDLGNMDVFVDEWRTGSSTFVSAFYEVNV